MKQLSILLDFTYTWHLIFGSDHQDLTAVQTMTRAFVTFIIALILIRIAGIRSFGSKSAFDIVLSITVGAVLSRCITGHYSYFACVGASAVLALMHRLFAVITFYSPWWNSVVKGKPDMLITKGILNVENLKMHNLTEDDLLQAAHKSGINSILEIEDAIFETDGKISIIPKHPPGI